MNSPRLDSVTVAGKRKNSDNHLIGTITGRAKGQVAKNGRSKHISLLKISSGRENEFIS